MLASTARHQLRRQLGGPRLLSTSNPKASVTPKIPTLGSITHSPETAVAFKEKLLAFRESVAAQRKAASRPAAPVGAEASDASPDPAGAAAAAGTSIGGEGVPRPGIVKSILYGSEKGRREEAEMEQSYSKVLARGKYVHAIEFHQVKPGSHAEYLELVGNTYPDVAANKANNCHLVGSWKTEIGDPDTFVHIWEYKGYAGYHDTLNQLTQSDIYQTFNRELPSLLTGRRTDLMQEFSFWPTSPPRNLGGIFELRSYTLHPGNLLEWETHWRAGLQARRNVMEGVGAWFTQVGALNNVHYLWQFQDLRARQVAREKSWGERGWSGTVHKTVPLIQRMESRILVPLPWSPVS